MSLDSCIPNYSGTYQISNVVFTTQYAGFPNIDNPFGVVGGYQSNQDPGTTLWDVEITSSSAFPQFTLFNHAVGTYASIPPNGGVNQVTGNPDNQFVWTAASAVTNDGQQGCIIFAPYNNGVGYWTLADGQDGTPITLQNSPAASPATHLWTFTAVN